MVFHSGVRLGQLRALKQLIARIILVVFHHRIFFFADFIYLHVNFKTINAAFIVQVESTTIDTVVLVPRNHSCGFCFRSGTLEQRQNGCTAVYGTQL